MAAKGVQENIEQPDCLAPWDHPAAVQVSIIMWYLHSILMLSHEIIRLPGPSRINDSGGLMDPRGSMVCYHG